MKRDEKERKNKGGRRKKGKKMKALDLEGLTIGEVAPLIRKKQISPLELTRRYLDRIKTLNPLLNAYLAMTEEDAVATARRAEREISKGNYRGPLHGIPFSIKDNIAIKGVTTTAGSNSRIIAARCEWHALVSNVSIGAIPLRPARSASANAS